MCGADVSVTPTEQGSRRVVPDQYLPGKYSYGNYCKYAVRSADVVSENTVP